MSPRPTSARVSTKTEWRARAPLQADPVPKHQPRPDTPRCAGYWWPDATGSSPDRAGAPPGPRSGGRLHPVRGPVADHLHVPLEIGPVHLQPADRGKVLKRRGMWVAVVVVGADRDQRHPRLQGRQKGLAGARGRPVRIDITLSTRLCSAHDKT